MHGYVKIVYQKLYSEKVKYKHHSMLVAPGFQCYLTNLGTKLSKRLTNNSIRENTIKICVTAT